MTDWDQSRLDRHETILTPHKVRKIEPSDLDISPPTIGGTGRTPEELREELRETAKEASKHSRGDVTEGAAVFTDQDSIYSGSRLEVAGEDPAHAIRVAVFKALSEGAQEISDVTVYQDSLDVEICSSCRGLLEKFGTSGLTIRTIDTTDRERQFSLDEI